MLSLTESPDAEEEEEEDEEVPEKMFTPPEEVFTLPTAKVEEPALEAEGMTVV